MRKHPNPDDSKVYNIHPELFKKRSPLIQLKDMTPFSYFLDAR